jgi:glutamine amidotransferase
MSEFPIVAIVDYGMGNLFSVQQACRQAGLEATITRSASDIEKARAVILPGIGAFGSAMATLSKLGLVEPLRGAAASGKPLVGICLGMQLLMTESHEFGRHRGLDLIPGEVVRFSDRRPAGSRLKVPQIGWNRIFGTPAVWKNTLLRDVRDGEYMYFVHSYYCKPEDATVILSTTRYGETEFCSSLQWRNIFACQFHPERSGLPGLSIYDALSASLNRTALQALKS